MPFALAVDFSAALVMPLFVGAVGVPSAVHVVFAVGILQFVRVLAPPCVRVERELSQGAELRRGRQRCAAAPSPRLVDSESPPAKLEAVKEGNRVVDGARVAVLGERDAAVAKARGALGQPHVTQERPGLAGVGGSSRGREGEAPAGLGLPRGGALVGKSRRACVRGVQSVSAHGEVGIHFDITSQSAARAFAGRSVSAHGVSESMPT